MGADESGNQPAPRIRRVPITPKFQTGVMIAGNTVILVAVLVSMKAGYAKPRQIPPTFLWLEITVLSVGLLTAFPEELRSWLYALALFEKPPPKGPLGWWLQRRDNVQRYLVYLLSGVVVTALIYLVRDTGGVIESPYVPFLTAPALFGPLVAKRWGAVVLLVVVVSATIAILGATEGAPHAAITNPHTVANPPDPWVYWSTAIILIATAGAISAARLAREGQLEAYATQLESDLRAHLTKSMHLEGEQPIARRPDDEQPDAVDAPSA